MVRSNNLYLSVPNFFRCPISLDVMKSPVSLSTGVTYDRSSIQTWLDNGNNTCPATMQVLQTKDFVPNHTLQRLIQIWSESRSAAQPSSISPQLAVQHLKQIGQDPNPTATLARLYDFVKESPKNKDLIVGTGCFRILADFFVSNAEKVDRLEAGVKILRLALADGKEIGQETEKLLLDSGFLMGILRLLQKGRLRSRVDSARVLEAIAKGESLKPKISVTEKEGILFELLRLVGWEAEVEAIDAGLSCLISLAALKPVRSQIVRLGAVPLFGKLLQQPGNSVAVVEKVLKLLEAMSTCTEGRAAICEDPTCVPAMVGKILKVSETATERAVVVLWTVCHMFKNRTAQEKVSKSNGMAKILLLMQSNCAPAVRQMACDLLKIFRLSSNTKGCLTSYDTKTTHIMPF
ncbi:U-box domain-containing protein 27-like [Aristolochia californica]|uniref:U-box domain-containing protein 27-like n=1 Tax=Aristolochia californica TaxID=171875 RepID=UPI0035E13606